MSFISLQRIISIGFIVLLNSLIFYPVMAQDAYTYDANGNMIQGGDYTYDYNDDNRLTRISRVSDGSTVAEYFYDASGQRVKKVEGGVTTYYIASHYETRTDGATTANTSYYFANNERIARIDNDGQTFYYHGDHLRSTSVVTDESGVLDEKVSYMPYGAVKEHTGSGSTYLFTDQEFDPESGLYYYDARYYNAELTRFTQADTVIQNVYNPQNLNEYAYVMNNPVKYTDPSGNTISRTGHSIGLLVTYGQQHYSDSVTGEHVDTESWGGCVGGEAKLGVGFASQLPENNWADISFGFNLDNTMAAINIHAEKGNMGLTLRGGLSYIFGGVGTEFAIFDKNGWFHFNDFSEEVGVEGWIAVKGEAHRITNRYFETRSPPPLYVPDEGMWSDPDYMYQHGYDPGSYTLAKTEEVR